jgi:hypothetical protein
VTFDAARLTDVLIALAGRRPVFHSEADFQHALAWELHLSDPDSRVRLETRPLPGRSVFLDLAAIIDGTRVAIELKYLTRTCSVSVEGETFALRQQSAHDIRRYDVIKDIVRLEEVVAAGAADVGLAVVLTNDPAYWGGSIRAGTSDAAFRVPDGGTLTGTLAWAATAGAGTMKGREAPLTLAGTYALGWADYSDLGVAGGRFRRLVIEVRDRQPNRPHPSPVATPSAVAPSSTPAAAVIAARSTAADAAEGLRLSCRAAVLAGLDRLERRGESDDFSVAELLSAAQAAGASHSEATIRTHITSIMCVNAPTNHAVRYPDLERVAPGRYRRATASQPEVGDSHT